MVLVIPLVYLFAVIFNQGLVGIWWGLVTGNLLGSIIAFTWGRHFIRRLLAKVPE